MQILKLTEEKKKWQAILNEYDGIDDDDRNLVITPYFGNYGLAGYVITINGSPVRGTLVYSLVTKRMYILVAGELPKMIWQNYAEKASVKSKSVRMWRATIGLLKAGGLRLRIGGGENPEVYIIEG